MSIRAIEGLVPAWYTPAGQDDVAPARFKLRPLDGEQYGDVADHVGVINDDVRISSKGIGICLRHALVDWDNFEGSDGPVPFSIHAQRLIPYTVRAELATHVFVASGVSDDQKKTC